MSPRRLLPYLLLFLVLLGTYLGLTWRQEKREARELEARKIFSVKEGEIKELALIRGKDEIRLSKKEEEWHLTKPLAARADDSTVDAMLITLATLDKERDLGTQKDLKSFGLDQPGLIVEFTARGKSHRLAIGGKTPGDKGSYALKDQDPRVLLISAASQYSLDRRLTALRDKTLFAFTPDTVTAIKMRMGRATVQLERTGPENWRWVGREDLKVRPDRVAAFLRNLQTARVKEFVDESPKQLRPYGLAPRPPAEVILTREKGSETLILGGETAKGVYARRGEEGPVVLVDQDLMANLTKTMSSLEDRRLWAGPVAEVKKVVWGPPGKPWTAVKEKNLWKLSGPEKAELTQPALRVEAALWKFTQLEGERIVPQRAASGGQEKYLLEAYDGAGKPLVRLSEMAKTGRDVAVRAQVAEKILTALIPQKEYLDWQQEMERLTAPPKK
jgi:hypothetical protein